MPLLFTWALAIIFYVVAAMAELADAQCSGRCMVIHVQVRLLFAASGNNGSLGCLAKGYFFVPIVALKRPAV